MRRAHLDRYGREVICSYRGNTYRVRDNGAVRRLRRNHGRLRPLDETWTFGRPSRSSGYMCISSVPVHRVVATAFHGDQPSNAHVVDHVDTNRRNNRPENLRWVTRLENILLNPVTAKRVAVAYGSIEAFLENPKRPLEGGLTQDFDWMRTVSASEAKASRERLMNWAKEDGMPSGGRLGEWLFRPNAQPVVPELPEDPIVQSKTPGAVQRKWRVPAEFPNCPKEPNEYALSQYQAILVKGSTFAVTPFGNSKIECAALSETKDAVVVHCKHDENAVKDWSVAKVTIENGNFVHESLGTFFTFEGAEKEFTIARGLTWEGGDTFDDYC